MFLMSFGTVDSIASGCFAATRFLRGLGEGLPQGPVHHHEVALLPLLAVLPVHAHLAQGALRVLQ